MISVPEWILLAGMAGGAAAALLHFALLHFALLHFALLHFALCAKATARGYRLALRHLAEEIAIDRARFKRGAPCRTVEEVVSSLLDEAS